MKLYWLAAERRYVHRQSDIPKGVDAEPQDIPTDLSGLMLHLNDLHRAMRDERASWKRTVDSLNRDGPDTHVVEGRNCAVVNNERDVQSVLDAGAGVGVIFSEKIVQEIEEPSAPIVPPPPDMTATAVLSRCDNPGTNVDAVVETICKAKGYALKRYAGAVATAFHQLENR